MLHSCILKSILSRYDIRALFISKIRIVHPLFFMLSDQPNKGLPGAWNYEFKREFVPQWFLDVWGWGWRHRDGSPVLDWGRPHTGRQSVWSLRYVIEYFLFCNVALMIFWEILRSLLDVENKGILHFTLFFLEEQVLWDKPKPMAYGLSVLGYMSG